MYFNPQPIIGSMEDSCRVYNDAINRVIESWNDKVSDRMQVSCIGELTQAGQNATQTMINYGNSISDLLSEMEYFARR